MSSSIKYFKNIMNLEEIRGQRILTSFVVPPEDTPRVEIFAKNIPENLDENQVMPFFEYVGPVHTLRLMMNKNNDGNRGFAYVTYLYSKDAASAIKLLDGKEIVKNYPVSVTHSMNNCRIFLGGIPVKKTKDEVWQELEKKGVTNIIDVIMYRSYNNRAQNRGFVFVEFPSHQYAAKMRNKMKSMCMWNNEVIVDWSVPEMVVPEEDMMKVKILYLRNLEVMESRDYLKAVIEKYVNPQFVQKVYKFKNYAFIHLITREVAEELLNILRDHYRNTPVEVTFAKPSSEFTKPEYRKQILSKTSRPSQTKSESTSKSSSYDMKYTVGGERTLKSMSPLQEIGNSNSCHPKNYFLGSNPSSYYSTFEDIISHKKSTPPSLHNDFSLIPSRLHANEDFKQRRWSDILKSDEESAKYVDPYEGVVGAGNMLPNQLDNLNRSVYSKFQSCQENTPVRNRYEPDLSSYSFFESELQDRKNVERMLGADSIQELSSFESSPKCHQKKFPNRLVSVSSSSKEQVDLMKEKENMDSLGYLRSFGNLQERMQNTRIGDSDEYHVVDKKFSSFSQYSPWGKVHTAQTDQIWSQFPSFGSIPPRGQNHMAPRSLNLGADNRSRQSCEHISFDHAYINELFSDQE